MATGFAEVTVSGTAAETLPGVRELLARMFVVPAELPVAMPLVLIEAAELLELHVVLGCVVNSWSNGQAEQLPTNVPSAVNLCWVPSAMAELVGAMAMD